MDEIWVASVVIDPEDSQGADPSGGRMTPKEDIHESVRDGAWPRRRWPPRGPFPWDPV